MFYVLDDNKNLVPAFDQEGFLAILREVIEDQSLENIDPTSAIASKLRSIINDKTWTIEFITRSQYNELKQAGELDPDTYYVIIDENIFERVDNLERSLPTDLDGSLDGFTLATSSTHLSAGLYLIVSNINIPSSEHPVNFTTLIYFDGSTVSHGSVFKQGGTYAGISEEMSSLLSIGIKSNGVIVLYEEEVKTIDGSKWWVFTDRGTPSNTYFKKIFAPTN